jgi:hypothetical protein
MKEYGEKILIALLLIALLFLWIKLFGFQKILNEGQVTSEPVILQPQVPETPIETKTPSTLTGSLENQNLRTFTSYELGLRFSYLEKTPKLSVATVPKEEDTTVIFGDQTIEFFEKDPEQSLEEAIVEHFGVGDEFPECSVLLTEGRTALLQFKTAELRVPTFIDSSDVRCPEEYFSMEEVRFFFFDPKFPDRFYFLSLGKNPGAFAPNGKDGWFKTLEVISQS